MGTTGIAHYKSSGTSVLELISNRIAGRIPVSFLQDGDPATFNDEVSFLF